MGGGVVIMAVKRWSGGGGGGGGGREVLHSPVDSPLDFAEAPNLAYVTRVSHRAGAAQSTRRAFILAYTTKLSGGGAWTARYRRKWRRQRRGQRRGLLACVADVGAGNHLETAHLKTGV